MRILTGVKRRHWGDSWTAVDDDTYDGPGSPLGQGRTEAEAIQDLQEQLTELEQRRHERDAIAGGGRINKEKTWGEK